MSKNNVTLELPIPKIKLSYGQRIFIVYLANFSFFVWSMHEFSKMDALPDTVWVPMWVIATGCTGLVTLIMSIIGIVEWCDAGKERRW